MNSFLHPFKWIIIFLFLTLISIGLKAQDYSDSISVNFFLLDECIITINMTKEINSLYQEFSSDSIHFVGYFPNLSSKPKKIEAFKEKYKLELPTKTDYFKMKSMALGASIMPEVFVVDERTQKILYKGRIDNTYDKVGSRRRVTTEKNLRWALEAIINKHEINISETHAIGCFINFKEIE